MQASNWNSLLKLLGLIVMVDGKVYHEEVDAFAKAAMKLQKMLNPDMFLSQMMIIDWFKNHREQLKAIVDSLEYDSHLIEIIKPIRGLPQKKQVLNAMISIAESDSFYHSKEHMIINKAARYWNVSVSELNLDPRRVR